METGTAGWGPACVHRCHGAPDLGCLEEESERAREQGHSPEHTLCCERAVQRGAYVALYRLTHL